MPALPTIAAGSRLTAARLNFAMRPPMARLRQSAVQTLVTGVATPLTFTTEVVDIDPDGIGGHSNSGSTSRYTARYPGWYVCAGGCTFQTNATGIRMLRWAVNGVNISGNDVLVNAVSGNTTRISARTELVYLDVSDYVELLAQQTCGVNLNTAVSPEEQASMNVIWRGAA